MNLQHRGWSVYAWSALRAQNDTTIRLDRVSEFVTFNRFCFRPLSDQLWCSYGVLFRGRL